MSTNNQLTKDIDRYFTIQDSWLHKTCQVTGINHAMLKNRLQVRLTEKQVGYLFTATWHNRQELADWLGARIPRKNFLD